MLPNTLVVKASRSLFQTNDELLVHVTGFSPKKLSNSNRYMEWVLPAGRYEVAVQHPRHRVATQFWLSYGKRTEMEVISKKQYLLWTGFSAGLFLVSLGIGIWSFATSTLPIWPMLTSVIGTGLATIFTYRQYRKSPPFEVKLKRGTDAAKIAHLPFL